MGDNILSAMSHWLKLCQMVVDTRIAVDIFDIIDTKQIYIRGYPLVAMVGQYNVSLKISKLQRPSVFVASRRCDWTQQTSKQKGARLTPP